MSPEQEILQDLLLQADTTRTALQDTLSLLDPFPSDAAAFAAMTPAARVASTALLKQFEQLEDALSRMFRTVLKLLGQQLRGLFALDIARLMVELGVLDDPEHWVAIVKLRNQLVHEYPLRPAKQLERLKSARAGLDFMTGALTRTHALVLARNLLDAPRPGEESTL